MVTESNFLKIEMFYGQINMQISMEAIKMNRILGYKTFQIYRTNCFCWRLSDTNQFCTIILNYL